MSGTIFRVWTSTRYDTNNVYSFLARTADPLNAFRSSADRNYSGYNVRCVLKDPEPEVPQYIQDVTNGNCPRTPVTVIDRRDNESYTIQKLADDNCWMLENLRTDPVAVSLANLKGNTNASDTTLEYLKGLRAGTSADKYAMSAVSVWTSDYSYSDPLVYTADKNTLYTWGNDFGKAGVYYNVCAASAGSHCYGSGHTYLTTDVEPTITEDICPKGWHIPTGNTGGEFQTLFSIYGVNNVFRNAIQLPFAGMYYETSTNNTGRTGYYLTSTTYSASGVYETLVGTSNSIFVNGISNANGDTVRCIVNH